MYFEEKSPFQIAKQSQTNPYVPPLHLLFLTFKMTVSDLEQLLEMGFDKERAELAVSKTGGRAFFFLSENGVFIGYNYYVC